MTAKEKKKDGTPDELNLELRDLSTRDLLLWSIALLVMLVVAIGFACLVVPNILWKSGPLNLDTKLMPQFVSGFLVLVVLFNIYIVDQKRRLNRLRDRLVHRMLLEDRDEAAFVDSLTGLYTRQYAEQLLRREAERADRNGATITFAYLDILNFRQINQRFGSLAGDHLLMVFSKMLKSTFRGSDLVARFAGDEFLAMFPDTTEGQAKIALDRLDRTITAWNRSTEFSYKLDLKIGISSYTKGKQIAETLQLARVSASPAKPHGADAGWSFSAELDVPTTVTLQ